MKHTEPEHPDYFYIESVLQRLADFLAELNDSIQYSMEVVTSDSTPKLKRCVVCASSCYFSASAKLVSKYDP